MDTELDKSIELDEELAGVIRLRDGDEAPLVSQRRPPKRLFSKYKTVVELESRIDKYFKGSGIKTASGLARFLGFSNIGAYLGLVKRGVEYADLIDASRLRIMEYYEELGQVSKSGNFADRMLTRLHWFATEKVSNDGVDEVAKYSAKEWEDIQKRRRRIVKRAKLVKVENVIAS